MSKMMNINYSKNELKYLLKGFQSVKNGALTFFGPSGTAKSHLFEEISKELGWGYLKIITPSLLLHHLTGKPDFERGIDKPMAFIPTKGNLAQSKDFITAKRGYEEIKKRLGNIDPKNTKNTILLHLDEIFRVVNKNVATLLFGLISDRMIGMGNDNDIPDNIIIIMSGNLEKGQSISLGDIASLTRMVLIPFAILKENVLDYYEKQGLIPVSGMKKVIGAGIDNFNKHAKSHAFLESYQVIRKALRGTPSNLRQIDYYLRLANYLYPLYSIGELSSDFIDLVDIGCFPSQTEEDRTFIKSFRSFFKPSGITLAELNAIGWEDAAKIKGIKGTLISRLKLHFSLNGMIDAKWDEFVLLLSSNIDKVMNDYESLSNALLSYGKGLTTKFLDVRHEGKSLMVYLLEASNKKIKEGKVKQTYTQKVLLTV